MTDVTTGGAGAFSHRLDFSTTEAKNRIRARYRSEGRFRSYGMIALGVTALFVVVLIGDIIVRGVPAFTEHVARIDVPLKAEAFVGSDGKVSELSIRGADYFPVTRDALTAIIPGLSRANERTLARLLSSGAADDLRSRLVADPTLIGKTVSAPLLLSDDADIYLKYASTAITERPARGAATPSDTSGEITILTSANDFADEVVAVKASLEQRASGLSREAERLRRIGGAQVTERLADLDKQVAELREKNNAPSSEITLDDKVASVLVSIAGGIVKLSKLSNSAVTGDVLIPLSSSAEAAPGSWKIVRYATPESNRKVTDVEVTLLERLRSLGKVENQFAWRFLTTGDSREPELAGIRGALVGTAFTLFVTLLLSLPIGVLAAVYLEEFAPKNWITEIIEVNINNLAAVPSIVFGLLGLAVFLNFFDLPRSAPLVGGLVLALLVLPTIIIASRAALKSVPPSIKEAALGVGASHQQAVFHHVVPPAMPGIMTGTIIGMAHALGETAPLLMIGMVAFIVDVPGTLTSAATVLPVQIYLWSDLPEAAFKAKTAGLIIVLLAFLFLMNGAAIWLRRRFERRW